MAHGGELPAWEPPGSGTSDLLGVLGSLWGYRCFFPNRTVLGAGGGKGLSAAQHHARNLWKRLFGDSGSQTLQLADSPVLPSALALTESGKWKKWKSFPPAPLARGDEGQAVGQSGSSHPLAISPRRVKGEAARHGVRGGAGTRRAAPLALGDRSELREVPTASHGHLAPRSHGAVVYPSPACLCGAEPGGLW